MSEQVAIAMFMESLLVSVTALLLLQPKAVFTSPKAMKVATWSGLVLLCITFCWSVVVGCILYLNQMVIRL